MIWVAGRAIEPTDGLSPLGKLVPSAALLGRDVRSGRLVEVDVAVGGMSFHYPVFGPSHQGAVGDSELFAGLRFCQHATLAESIVAGAQAISFHKIDNAQVGEPGVGLTASC